MATLIMTRESSGSLIFGKVQVNIDEWFYNFGPNQFIQIFKFENGKLVTIENGNYGY